MKREDVIIVTLVLALIGSIPFAVKAQSADMRDALFAAMDASDGAYRGELQGGIRDWLHKALNTNSPVFVNVTSIQQFPQPGCKRLRAEVTVPDVKVTDKKTGVQAPFGINYEMNLCPDGSPPEMTGMSGKPSLQTK
jgi:hypothetical protein